MLRTCQVVKHILTSTNGHPLKKHYRYRCSHAKDVDEFESYHHTPVLLKETIKNLVHIDDGVYIDCTLGMGGHTLEILRNTKKAVVISIDRDIEAIEIALKNPELSLFKDNDRFIAVHNTFSKIAKVYNEFGLNKDVNGILMDIGVSSMQLDNPDRGFSYREDFNGPLDMRMDRTGHSVTAGIIVNTYPYQKLVEILRKYGEEPAAALLAKRIVGARNVSKIQTTKQLVDIIKATAPKHDPMKLRSKRLKRTFQAFRIVVNQEYDELKAALISSESLLARDGRLGIISFHSGEDTICKNFIKIATDPKKLSSGSLRDPNLNLLPSLYQVSNKPLVPLDDEIQENKRSKSAIMRVVARTSNPTLTEQFKAHGLQWNKLF